MAMEMRLPVPRKPVSESLGRETKKHLVVPGDTITTDTGFMRGHGTYMGEEKLIASVAGPVERVNKLICVKALKTRGAAALRCICAERQHSEQREVVDWWNRMASPLDKCPVDKIDIIVREGQGVLVQVSPSLVKRQKTHFHDLPCGASVILGNNGFIWIYPTREHKEEDAGGFIANLEPVSLADREVISRLRNCIVSLVTQRMLLYDTSILYCYEASLPHQIKDILKPEVLEEIVMETRQRLLEQEG
ncbi:hypothetical protein CB1_000576073 [Camelus ferus]|nr:hypothetical protein CB1_000576073 [Camelus ferus]